MRRGHTVALWVITIFTALVGLQLKVASDPGQPDSKFVNNPPQTLDVYVGDPRISAQLQAVISRVNTGFEVGFDESVQLKVVLPRAVSLAAILVLSSRQSDEGPVYFTRLIPPPDRELPDLSILEAETPLNHYYAAELFVSHLGLNGIYRSRKVFDVPIGSFNLPVILEKTDVSTFGHLPSIGAFDVTNIIGGEPAVLGEERGLGAIKDIVIYPRPEAQEDNRPSVAHLYQTPYGGPPKLFWVPRHFSVTESLQGIASVFRNEQTDYVAPIGELNGDTYTWKASNDLEPTFKFTNPEAANSQNNDAFLSGILLGVAAASALALIQELPENIPAPGWWITFQRRYDRRKRRSSASS